MLMNTSVQNFFAATDSITICDVDGNILFYAGFNEEIMMLKNKDCSANTIFDMYPFIPPEDFVVLKAIKSKKPILNELQILDFYGKKKRALSTAYPLMHNNHLFGGMVITIDLDKASYPTKHNFEDIITQDPEFLRRLEALKIFSRSNSSILIYGETGTGKELVAHSIHANSTRYGKPFIIQNCAAIPENLIESIFFGTTKGSFTGSMDKIGLFEAANGGTLFLDEINSLPLDLQGKILRAIENKTITRIGDSKDITINVRIIASTNEDLAVKVSNKQFRADLYYRLNVIRFDIPPLRNRRRDIELLCNHYLHYYNALLGRDVIGIDSSAQQHLCAYSWPGNVRELKNLFEATLNLKQDGFVTSEDLPSHILNNYPSAYELIEEDLLTSSMPFGTTNNFYFWNQNQSLEQQINNIEKNIIEEALSKNKNNVSATAKALDVSRQTLYNKMTKYKLI